MRFLQAVLVSLCFAVAALAADGDITKPNVGIPAPVPVLSVYEGATATLSGTPSKVTFQSSMPEENTMAGTYTDGVFDCGPGGYFSVNAAITVQGTIALNNALTLAIYINGVPKRSVTQPSAALLQKVSLPIQRIVYCPEKGKLTIMASTNILLPNITTVTAENTLSIMQLFINKSGRVAQQ